MNYNCQSMVKNINAILLKKPSQAFLSQDNLSRNYQKYAFTGPPDYEAACAEYEAFEKIISENVENVYYLPQDLRAGLDSIYTHDPVKITKKGAIYFSMGKALRSQEYLATKDFLESQGVPTLGIITAPAKMEGGDVLWIDEQTVALGRGYRTNDEGIRQFKELTASFIKEVIVVPMPHADGMEACLHLMSIISFVDSDLAVVYSKYMPVFFREYLLSRGVKLIEVSDKEYDNLGSNVLTLAPRKCVIMDGNPHIRQKLLDEGVTLFTYKGSEISFKGTGGPTCLTCPIERL